MEKELEPLAMFLYSIKSDETKKKYRNKLASFFDFVGLKGTLDEKAIKFAERGRTDVDWAFSWVMKFVSYQRERAEKNEIVNGTVLNYYKPVKLFCEVNEIDIKWKRISRGLPRGRRKVGRIAVWNNLSMKERSPVYQGEIQTDSGKKYRFGLWNFKPKEGGL